MKRLPKFKSEEQEARFWDTHSPLDYPGEFSEVREPFEFAPEEYMKLETLAAKEKGKEKRVTRKLIDNLEKKGTHLPTLKTPFKTQDKGIFGAF